MMRHLAFGLAVAAMAVTASRLVIAYLEADRVPIDRDWRVGLLTLTAVATGVVVTGGLAYLAHASARRRRYRPLLVLCCGLVLVAAAVLLTPLLVGALAGQHLSEVLVSSAWRWTWSAVAVLAPEVIAAGCMVAYAGAEHDLEQIEELEQQLEQVATERNRRESELVQLRGELVQLTERAGELDELEQQLSELREHRASTASRAEQVECRNGCGFFGASSKAEAGHQRACPAREAAE